MKCSSPIAAMCVVFSLLLLAGPGAAPAAPHGVSLKVADKTPLVDLNSAPKPELVKLPGVGDAIADKIIAGRPWKSKYDLVVKKVVARSTYDKFAKLIIARQPDEAK